MGDTDTVYCPVRECSVDGTVSQVIHHITETDDGEHQWDAIGFDNSFQFRQAQAGSSGLESEPNACSDKDSKYGGSAQRGGDVAKQPGDADGARNNDEVGNGRHSDPVKESKSGGDGSSSKSEYAQADLLNNTGPQTSFPETMVASDQWLLWKATDDGRKIPRAPWATGDANEWVNGLDPANWTSFAEASEWQSKLPDGSELAYALTREDEIVFLDLDDVIVDDKPTAAAERLLDDAGSYAAVSTSGTGIHIFVEGDLSEGTKSLTGPLGDDGDQTVEVYDRNRFVAMTGNHIEGTHSTVADGSRLITQLEERFASVSSETPDRATVEPQRSRSELRDLETTTDINDLFAAISQTRPSDIRLRSTQTREHGDGTFSYDPSWVYSESGTRLGVLDDVWIYRKGMIALNALQVVALEEGILTDERQYPEGEQFWDAVEALRERGAHIPQFEPDSTPVGASALEELSEAIDESEVSKRLNYDHPVRIHVHKYDRDYQESLALKLAPVLVEAAKSLDLGPAVTYRAAELYAKAHRAGLVPGAAHESSLGAALRVASTEAGVPRPLAAIADTFDENTKTIRQKFHRMAQDEAVSETFTAADVIVDPPEYIPYMIQQLDRDVPNEVSERVRRLLAETELDGSSNPMSVVAAGFYAVMKESKSYSVTQGEIARAAGLSEVTIRNNYRQFQNRT